MAQFLIRKREHFAESVKPATWSDLKWGGRPLRGDVVECRENGYWGIAALNRAGKGWDRTAFALVEITNLTLQQVAAYQGGYIDNPENPTKKFKNRYYLPNWNVDIPWNIATVTLDGRQVEEWYYIRSNIHSIVTPVDKASL